MQYIVKENPKYSQFKRHQDSCGLGVTVLGNTRVIWQKALPQEPRHRDQATLLRRRSSSSFSYCEHFG